jgi:hypothetical protein
MSEQDKIPTSPDSFKRPVKTVTPGMTMGGVQTGGYAATPSTEPKPQPEPSSPEQMIKRTVLKTEK